MKRIFLLLTIFLVLSDLSVNAQAAHVKKFPLKQVKLLDSPFRDAMLKDLDYIMKMDPDRLLAPYLKEAGLEPKAENYPNWESMGLDGHIGGHYLTALAQMYASTKNGKAYDRLKYMVDELEKVQQANGNGYIGGVPEGKKIWQEIQEGNINASSFGLNDRWVPLYNIHKTYAGLRDAYRIAGINEARGMLIDFTDWMIAVTSNLSDAQIQELLISEHGGLNETFADVYEITGDKKYLELAHKFSHKKLLEPMQSHEDVLSGMHANTQIPKIIGFETIAQLEDNSEYHEAAEYFWDNVVNERSVAIGGNSVREHFNPVDDFSSMITSEQGPETCNTYNMLKLTEKLFQAQPQEKYIDFYERSLYNHILSSQHPDTGGFVYFTPMRPGHYRVYSQPETSFWCCVGSGLENHGKYNEMIYAHSGDSLYVNLFIPSKLTWDEKRVNIVQENNLEESEATFFTIQAEKPKEFTLLLRYPAWVKQGKLEVTINEEPVEITETPGSYISLNRIWKDGDRVSLKLPMHLIAEDLPDNSNYTALTYGPFVLGAKMGDEELEGLYADAGRSSHIASGKKIPLSQTPVFVVENPEKLTNSVEEDDAEELKFSATDVLYPSEFNNLEFIPFYKIHDSRYVVYLPVETPETLIEIEKSRKEQALEEKKLEAITVDYVSPGEQQPESDHLIESENSNIGINQNRHWRDATGWFSYVLQDKNNEASKLKITYYGQDRDRDFKIFLEDSLIAHEELNVDKGDAFFTREYEIPDEILNAGKKELIIRFEAAKNSRTAGIYGVRLIKDIEN